MLARRDEYASKALITRSASDVSTVSKISTHLPILTAKVLQQNDNHIFAESSNGLQNSLSFSLHARSFSSSLLSSVKCSIGIWTLIGHEGTGGRLALLSVDDTCRSVASRVALVHQDENSSDRLENQRHCSHGRLVIFDHTYQSVSRVSFFVALRLRALSMYLSI
ncbi:hypothetical protein KC343_g40 [Hortaea werneckii]|nr:hypothetical protein KC346_g42 [Hortaea werneckii]KAI7638452.1 hypothetical protein KC343_g40 [Hortaea werneckii]